MEVYSSLIPIQIIDCLCFGWLALDRLELCTEWGGVEVVRTEHNVVISLSRVSIIVHYSKNGSTSYPKNTKIVPFVGSSGATA